MKVFTYIIGMGVEVGNIGHGLADPLTPLCSSPEQMEPLRKALKLPRVNLFIADDTGLGKTIEAGLIARELLLRRKVKNIVVAAPPSVLEQWQAEMEERMRRDRLCASKPRV